MFRPPGEVTFIGSRHTGDPAPSTQEQSNDSITDHRLAYGFAVEIEFRCRPVTQITAQESPDTVGIE